MWTLDKSVVQVFDKSGGPHKELFRLDFYYRSMLIDKTNIYLIARTGMHVYDKEFNRIKDLTELADYKFSEILDLNDSTLLLSSIGNGFFLLNKNTWKHTQYNARNKFVASDIYTTIKTDSTVWFGTEKGIIRTPINSLLKDAPMFQILTQKSDLVSDKTRHLLEVNDEIWAFDDHGYSAFPKNIALTSTHVPVFYIQTITANDKPLTTLENAVLPHTDNNLTINFGFIDFSNQNIFTRYRLTREDSWDYTTERSLKFYSLSPGAYEFLIEYSVDNVRWIKSDIFPRFTILPPWWQTWYFQTAIALLVLLVTYLYFKNQVNVYRKHQQKLIESELEAIEQERSRIAKDLHDSVGTDFTAIKMVVSQLLKKHHEPKSEEIETQFQNTIQDIKTIIYGLSPPGLERYGLMAGVKNYVDKLNGTIPVNIEYNSFGPDIKDLRINITIFRILQELISNSLKHSNAKTIALHINAFDDLLNIVYEDNGKGFSWDNNQTGLGLYNIESRIQSINGRFHFDSGSFGVSYTIDVPLVRDR
jgi:signal transduction histidine kinase